MYCEDCGVSANHNDSVQLRDNNQVLCEDCYEDVLDDEEYDA